MHRSNRALLLLAGLTLATASTAQPYKYGCHYFRHHPHAHAGATAADRELIADVIARSDTFNILHYDIAIDVTNYSGQQITAATTIFFTPLMADQNFIRFELWGLTVDSVTIASGPLTFSQDTMMLRVNFTSPPTVGDTAALTVYYHGSPHRDPDWGGFYFESGYIYNMGIGLTTIPPNFGKVWYPCLDSFVERATYTYHVKSAGAFRAHCQGEFLGEEQLGGDTVIRSFNFNQPIPTHLSAIAVSNYQDSDFMHAGAYGDVPVRLTAKPAQLNAMVAKFADLGAAIDACEFWYGPYPWGRVGYVLTTDGALEIPENVAYPDFMTSQSVLDNRGLFAHELGHHWWGDLVTPRTQQDMWMKEGPAEYSSHLLEEWLGGASALVAVEKKNQLYVLENANVQDGGFQPLSPMPDPYIYGLTTYYKGAAVMHNLRGYLGDTLFRQAMHNVLAAHAYSTLDAAGFRDALEDATGYDLHPFFQDQVFSPGFAVFVVHSMSAQQQGGAWNVDLSVQQKLRGTMSFHHDVPLDITLIGADGQRQEYRELVGGEFTDVQLTADFEPKMAVLNGHHRLNQARMAYETTLVPGENFNPAIPYVHMLLYADTLVDSTLVRVEHVWAAPDQQPLGWGIDQISSAHYWNVDGLWPEGTALHAKLYYAAQDSTDLDHDLYGTTEDGALLVYRADPSMPWTIYPDQTLYENLPDNGSGSIGIDVLRKGQYAFAKGPGIAGIAEPAAKERQLVLYPVPASGRLMVKGAGDPGDLVRARVYGTTGRMVLQAVRTADASGNIGIDVGSLANGAYVLEVRGISGLDAGRSTFVVRH